MSIKELEDLIINLEVGGYWLMTILGKADQTRAYRVCKEAAKYGYDICFSKVREDKFYMEKLKEGNRMAYEQRRKREDLWR